MPANEQDERAERIRYVWRRLVRVLAASVLVGAAAGVMYAEGQHRPDPGIGFAIALVLMLGAAHIIAGGEK